MFGPGARSLPRRSRSPTIGTDGDEPRGHMPYFALFFDPQFSFAKAHVVRADRHHEGAESHTFWRGEREVYRAPDD